MTAGRGLKLTDSTIAVFSDIHCGSHQNSPLWHNANIEWAKQVKKELNKRGITDIIIPGDVFHDRNEIAVNTIHAACEMFAQWEDFNIIITVGNHDAYYRDKSDVHSLSVLNGWNNIHVVDTLEILEAFGRKLLFVPWGENNADQFPDVDVIFGHFEIETFKMSATKVCTHGLNPKKLLDKADLVITGHFHLRDERVYDNGTVLYLGSPYQLDWGDAGTTRGITILNLNTLEREFVPNDFSAQHIKFKLSDVIKKGSLNSFKIKGNIVRFVIDQEISPEQAEVFSQKITALKPFAFNVEWLYNSNIEAPQGSIEGVDIEKCIVDFISAMQVENKEDVLKNTLELYVNLKK